LPRSIAGLWNYRQARGNLIDKPTAGPLAIVLRRLIPIVSVAISAVSYAAPVSDYSFAEAQQFLKKYCDSCHGKAAVGGFKLQQVGAKDSLNHGSSKWTAAANRVKNGEMPPKGAPAPALEAREQFTGWVDHALRAEACASGIVPGPAPIRRLNRDEYASTLRDLLDMQMDIGRAFPADGAGGEGFDNAAETLFLSPLHSEKYMEIARFALDFAAKEHKSRAKIFTAMPGPGISERAAATAILKDFLPRAFRRPVQTADIALYVGLFDAAKKQGQTFEQSVLFSLRGVLVSPLFLFRIEEPNPGTHDRPVEAYAMASRLSYFLWGSMPDEFLFDVAASGKLHDPMVLKEVIGRMLRNDRSLHFSRRFVEQWLGTRALDGDKAPDPKLFPAYANDEDLRGDIRYQPILFFRELLLRNESLLNLIDSKHTIASIHLQKHFGEKLPLRANARQQPQWVELPEGSNRGGVLGMPAVLAVSSHPYRTSPVLRGAWILDALLGTPPPPPPPNVPPLEEPAAGASATTLRERLTQHRDNPVCASCHARIDGLGFALENFDVIGKWRTEDAGKPIDNSGELNDGTSFKGAAELKSVLMARKDLFIHNLTSKMLGYALGRGLTLKDSCAVDAIVAQVKASNYSASSLIESIVLSVPFQYQAGKPRIVSKDTVRPQSRKETPAQ
jgi:hypothetical protein